MPADTCLMHADTCLIKVSAGMRIRVLFKRPQVCLRIRVLFVQYIGLAADTRSMTLQVSVG